MHYVLSTELIENHQRRIKTELDQIGSVDGMRARSKAILERLAALPDSVELDNLLERYILAMSALVMEVNHRLYSKKVFSKLLESIESVLFLLSPSIKKTAFSFIEADFHRLVSQIRLRSGDFVGSLWKLEQAKYCSGKGSSDVLRGLNDCLGNGIRLHRIGLVHEAIENFKLYLSEGTQVTQKIRAIVGLMRTYRLLGYRKKYLELINSASPNELEILANEIKWDKAVYDTHLDGKLDALCQLHKKQTWDPTFTIDLYLRAFAHSTRKTMEKLAPLSRKKNSRKFDHRILGIEFEAVLVLEYINTASIPMASRIERFGNFVDRAPLLPTLEHQLLFIGSGIRWAKRRRLEGFASILMNEYAGIVQRINYPGYLDPCGLSDVVLPILIERKKQIS